MVNMKEEMAYVCDSCHKVVRKKGYEGNPDCCGRTMRQMPLAECVRDPAFAEHARSFEDDEPCDPGMSGP
ncbi:MAG: hypothetical protein ACMUIE_09845 [Thermoplasmatota archaeon]